MISLDVKSEQALFPGISYDSDGDLCFADTKVSVLAEKYGTPVYVMDEDRIRERCRAIKNASSSAFDGGAEILFASKACSFGRMYEIMKSESMSVDVVSIGEALTAIRADFPPERIYFHSNNKTDEDIKKAVSMKIGTLVIDNFEEIEAIDRIAGEFNVKQRVLVRVTPGIDPHTHKAISTGNIDSKFGFGIPTGMAEQAISRILSMPNIILDGYHCHIGSQIFESDVYLQTVDAMLDFTSDIGLKLGYFPEKLDLGGGFGVKYTKNQESMDICRIMNDISARVKSGLSTRNIKAPLILFEPGRFIVADAGMTLYTVGSVKKIPGYLNYVSVDGGMTDNIRYALYGSEYTFFTAKSDENDEKSLYTVAGRCCESGDILGREISLSNRIAKGDILAVATTGAYNYSMSSNYNRIPKPAVVMISKGKSNIAVKRQTDEDLLSLDCFENIMVKI